MRHVLAAALLLSGLPALGQSAPSPAPEARSSEQMEETRPDTLRQDIAQLDLTTEQKTQVEQIFSRNEGLFKQAADLRREMESAKEKNDQVAIERIKLDWEKLRPQVKRAAEQDRSEILSLLTPTQQQKLAVLRSTGKNN